MEGGDKQPQPSSGMLIPSQHLSSLSTYDPQQNDSNTSSSMQRVSSSLEKYGWFEYVEPYSPHYRNGHHDDEDDGELEEGYSLLSHRYNTSGGSSYSLQQNNFNSNIVSEPIQRTLSLPLPLTEPPAYILESPLASQHLWYTTAGTRPQQPAEERKHFEQLWKQNFLESSIQYREDVLVPSKGEEASERIQSLKVEFKEEVRGRGKGPFSNAVSKSFMNHFISCMTIQVPRFKVVRPLVQGEGSGHFHAQFLIVISLGSVPHGVWRRYSAFKELYATINLLNNTPGPYFQIYKNTILSWQCVLSKQRWFRCLDKNYLALKCFLIERFMQDLLFESPTPDVINEFLGLHGCNNVSDRK